MILHRGGFTAATAWAVLSDMQVTDYAAAPTGRTADCGQAMYRFPTTWPYNGCRARASR